MDKAQTQDLLTFASFYGLFDRPVQRVVEMYNNHIAALMAAQITGYHV